MKKLLIWLAFVVSLSSHAQTDSVDHFMPYLVHNQDIVGNYTWNKPLFSDDTIRYKVIVEDTSIHVTVRNDTLGITYKLAFVLDTYSIWIKEDSAFGPHWEMYESKGRRIRDLPILPLKIDEVPRLEPHKKKPRY